MNTKFLKEKKQLIFELTEEIDHHTSEEIKSKADDEISKHLPRQVVFDFEQVSFMDSAGIGMLLGRYKMVKMLGGMLEIVNVKQNIKKILEMSGVSKLIQIEQNNFLGGEK